MKKLFYVFVFSFAAAPLLAAVSTCETRVDKHQDASTSERVNYCLTEEPAPEEAPATEVVLSDVYSVQYPKPKTKKAQPQTQQTKIYNEGPTSMEYLDRDDYPAFRNDIMPSLSEDEAHAAAIEALSSQDTQENKGTKSLTKPGRVMKALPAEETATVTDTASYANYDAPAYDQAAYPAYAAGQTAPQSYTAPTYTAPAQTATPVQTPAADIQQVQNLQNDPLYQNYTDNGAAPAGFTQGGVMGPDGFGYNATDPAYQP